jgi:hypothetical protein
MLDDQAEATAATRSVILPIVHEVPAPDPLVVESARARLAERYAENPGQDPGHPAVAPADDVRAVVAVIESASGAGMTRADALDIGASLVLLCNLRVALDRIETDLLDATEDGGLTWDLVAAIMGIPVAAVLHYHAALRARRALRLVEPGGGPVTRSGHG